ncbi:unnamed protein product [Parnassius apollo]|uniref:(apollo) hypothetical protein n=1 Tax=Parnassius apollo TaxID=110799 RepID=A0A8S3WJG2_PARAO|nr:unnamed protein product [Parnassius apollo]
MSSDKHCCVPGCKDTEGPLLLKRFINTSAKRQPLQKILDLQKPSKSSDPFQLIVHIYNLHQQTLNKLTYTKRI